MDLEERISKLIGTQFLTILKLQSQIDALVEENESLKQGQKGRVPEAE